MALIGLGVASAPPARADQTTASAGSKGVPASKVAAWLDAQIDEARDLPLDNLRDVAFRFAYELHTLRSPAEIERLRTEIEGHPDHPMRRVVERYDRMLEEGPTVIEYAARVRSWDEWRLNQDQPPGDSLPWNDTVVTPTHAYQLNPSQIALIDPRVGYPPGRQINTLSHEFWNPVNFLLYGDLGTRLAKEIARGEVRVDGDHWSCEVRKPGQGTRRYEGRWVSAWDRGVVERATVIANPDAPKYVGWFEVFSGWKMDPILGRPVAARFERHFPDGSIAYAYIFRGAEREDPAVFNRVTAVPDVAGADPLRGPITATSMWDFRQGTRRYVSDLQGARNVVDEGPLPGANPTQSRSALRQGGWALLGAIVLGLVAIWMWRHSRQT